MISDNLRTAIAAGQTRAICPACGGGSSREQSLSIRQDGPIVSLYCFRNTCGWRHVAGSGDAPSARREREPRVYDGPLQPVGYAGVMGERLDYDYELDPRDYFGRWWEGEPGSLVMAALGPHGQLRGHTTRTFTKPKRCMTYQSALAQPWLDWWLPDTFKKHMYLVEDQISACKIASLDHCAAALMGTQLSPTKAGEIAQVCKARSLKPVLALDPDATTTAFGLAARYGHALPGLAVLPLPDDPKDIPLNELGSIL